MPMATELCMLNKSTPSIFNDCLDNIVEFCLYFCVIIKINQHSCTLLVIKININCCYLLVGYEYHSFIHSD